MPAGAGEGRYVANSLVQLVSVSGKYLEVALCASRIAQGCPASWEVGVDTVGHRLALHCCDDLSPGEVTLATI